MRQVSASDPLAHSSLDRLAHVSPPLTIPSQLLDSFERRSDEIAEVVVVSSAVSRMRACRAYVNKAIETQLLEQAMTHVRLIGAMARTGAPPTANELEFARQVGIYRAQAGLAPLDTMLHCYLAGISAMCDWMAREAKDNAHELRAALGLTMWAFEYHEIMTRVMVAGYVQQRNELRKPLSSLEGSGDHRADLDRTTIAREAASAIQSEARVPDSANQLVHLSPREVDLVLLLTRGLTNKEIAARMRISVHTTKEYVSRILEKTGLRSRAAVAAAYAAHPPVVQADFDE